MSRNLYGSEMDREEVATFLEDQGLGTLSLGDEHGGYGIPMSFGYDRVNERCILQLSFSEDSRKEEYLEGEMQVTLSTYDWEAMDEWRSVVLHGTLVELSPGESSLAGGIFAAYSKIASPEIFQKPLRELDFEWYELDIEEMHGRQARGQ